MSDQQKQVNGRGTLEQRVESLETTRAIDRYRWRRNFKDHNAVKKEITKLGEKVDKNTRWIIAVVAAAGSSVGVEIFKLILPLLGG